MLYDEEVIEDFNDSMDQVISNVKFFIESAEDEAVTQNEYEQERHGWEQV